MEGAALPREYRHYRMGRLVEAPGARPHLFEVTLGPEALFEVGILAELASVFAREGIPLLQVKSSAAKPGERVRIILAADLRGREGDAARLAGELRRVRGVERVEHAPPLFDGVAVDAWSHPLLLDVERAVVLTEVFLAGMLSRGWSELGTAFAAILYHTALAGSLEGCRRVFERYGREDGLKLVAERFRLQGFGVLEVARLTARELVARVYDSIECGLQRGAGAPRGAIVRGIVSGIAAAYWGVGPEGVEVDEVKCLAKGDPHCEYVVRRR